MTVLCFHLSSYETNKCCKWYPPTPYFSRTCRLLTLLHVTCSACQWLRRRFLITCLDLCTKSSQMPFWVAVLLFHKNYICDPKKRKWWRCWCQRLYKDPHVFSPTEHQFPELPFVAMLCEQMMAVGYIAKGTKLQILCRHTIWDCLLLLINSPSFS